MSNDPRQLSLACLNTIAKNCTLCFDIAIYDDKTGETHKVTECEETAWKTLSEVVRLRENLVGAV